MILKELNLKSFGKFRDKKIALDDGINLIYGENEAGKSTIHTFIKGMLFGMERKRGRAAATDQFSQYEPWNGENYYAGALKFETGGRNFMITRNFDKYSKGESLICVDDGEDLNIAGGDLDMLLDQMSEETFVNTVFIAQTGIETGDELADRFGNYAMKTYMSGDGGINLAGTLTTLRNRQKKEDKKIRQVLDEERQKRSQVEAEMSYVWRERRDLESQQETLGEEIESRRRQREQEQPPYIEKTRWRIHPVEIILFIGFIVAALFLLPRPWNYIVSIVIFLLCGINIWNRLKNGRGREKTAGEKKLEEITPREEKTSIQQLQWEYDRLQTDIQDRTTQYGNLSEQLEQFDEASDQYLAEEKKKRALELAEHTLREISDEMRDSVEAELQKRTSQILSAITGGKYTRVFLDGDLNISVFSEERKVPLYQLSRGSLEQIYFALRVAVGQMMHAEEMPLIMDDCFVYFDDERLKNTLEWIGENEQQVIIMTCHHREERILAESGIPFRMIHLD